jgi:hypothetical protein
MATTFNVQFAVYGALAGGDENKTEASVVTSALQNQLNSNPNGVVAINNTTMGGDPAPGWGKHFGAIVQVNGQALPFACEEGQTIDFS